MSHTVTIHQLEGNGGTFLNVMKPSDIYGLGVEGNIHGNYCAYLLRAKSNPETFALVQFPNQAAADEWLAEADIWLIAYDFQEPL